jgi:hypothetical protein
MPLFCARSTGARHRALGFHASRTGRAPWAFSARLRAFGQGRSRARRRPQRQSRPERHGGWCRPFWAGFRIANGVVIERGLQADLRFIMGKARFAVGRPKFKSRLLNPSLILRDGGRQVASCAVAPSSGRFIEPVEVQSSFDRLRMIEGGMQRSNVRTGHEQGTESGGFPDALGSRLTRSVICKSHCILPIRFPSCLAHSTNRA